VAMGQTSRNWCGMTTQNGDVYACVAGGDIYKMSGSVYQIKMPTKNTDLTKDITGNTLMYPAGNYHNSAETLIDFTNGGINTTIPSTYNAVAFNSVLANPFFYRKLLLNGQSIRNDRYLIYSATQVEPSLTKITTYTQDTNL